MLDVLEQNRRAWYREVPPLLFGAVRARTGAGQPASLRWLYAARAAALMLLVASAPPRCSTYGTACSWSPT